MKKLLFGPKVPVQEAEDVGLPERASLHAAAWLLPMRRRAHGYGVQNCVSIPSPPAIVADDGLLIGWAVKQKVKP